MLKIWGPKLWGWGEILGSGSDGWVGGLGWKGTSVILKDLGTKVMGLGVRFWGQEVMVGLKGWVRRAPV